jgi:serine/threonine-protein kinase
MLLRAHQQPNSLLDCPAPAVASTVDEPITERPGTIIGPYKLMEQIGEGGMGLVFVAEQQRPLRRRVALKVIKPGMDSRAVIARFEGERQALALMDHENIAKVLDAGATASGRPYFVMELVKGTPITEYCDQNRLALRERLALFVDVCAAVQHAHQKGIIHRDIKPSNVLATSHDGTPVVKVIDFGVAKAIGQHLTDKTVYTQFTQLIGTPLYMSPEQAGQSSLDIDTRTDIYALGVLLYELLTGTTPFDKERFQGAGYDEIRRIIREEEAPKPSTRISTLGQAATTISTQRQSDPKRLSQLIRGELDWIVMKALEKDRNRRYETASAFAADVQHYLHDEPVLACPPSAWYRFRKFARRRKRALAMAACVVLALAGLAGGMGWAVRDRAARAAKASNDLELALDRAELFQGQDQRVKALAALDRVEMLAGEAGPDPGQDARVAALKERLDAEARDQEFIARFEEIRLREADRVNVRAHGFDRQAAFTALREALRRDGITIGDMAPSQAAACIQGRAEPVRGNLVAALEECLKWAPTGDSQTRQWLLAALEAADSNAWTLRARKTVVNKDWKALVQLVRQADLQQQPPSFLLHLARSLPAQMRPTRLELLRRIQRAYPADLWANDYLAIELNDSGESAEATRYYTAAVALRPLSPWIYLNRGIALIDAGEVDAAIADCGQALALAPQFAMAHYSLGAALVAKGRTDEAVAEFREALRLKKDLPAAHDGLGNALREKGRLDEAIAEYKEAVRIKSDDARTHYNLGNALMGERRWGEASAEYRETLRLDKDYAEAHCNLGLTLWQLDEFRAAREELRRGHELGSRNPRWPYPSAQWVRQCERLIELDGRLPAFLEGKFTPASSDERIGLAELCSLKGLRRAEALLYEQAFAAQPKLADDLRAAHRYNAACAASAAACGQAEDADKLDGKERARLRRQALAWLRADLEAWGRLLDKKPDQERSAWIANVLRGGWQASPSLAGVRGPVALAKLPDAERQQWQKLWADTAEMRARAGTSLATSPRKTDAK